LELIRDYTEQRWGAGQAAKYLADLEKSSNRLLEFPYLGSPFGGRKVKLRSLKSGQHRLVYEVIDDTVLLVRVLHTRMDLLQART
jgi:toxin ParE1/3/4